MNSVHHGSQSAWQRKTYILSEGERLHLKSQRIPRRKRIRSQLEILDNKEKSQFLAMSQKQQKEKNMETDIKGISKYGL